MNLLKTVDKKTPLTPNRLFYLLSIAGCVSFFALACYQGSAAFDWLCMRNTGRLRFVDYFQHVLFSAYPKQLYGIATGVWGCFPPLAYVFYRFLYCLTAVSGFNPQSRYDLLNTDYGLTVFVFYSILSALLLLFSISLWDDTKSGKRLFLCLLFSAPFLAGGIERGNAILLVVVLLLVSLKWRDSKSPLKRELAMLMIAVSAGLKIYPAVFGLLYLKEGRYKEAVRLVIYGIVLFFAPFAFFGGVVGLKLWLLNVIETMGMDCTGRIEFIKGAVSTLSYIITGVTNEYLAAASTNLFFVIMLLLAVLSGNQNRTVFYLCAIMALFPGNMHRYALTLFAIPLVILMAEQGNEKPRDPFIWIETILFAFMFSIPTLWGLLTGFRLHFAISDYITYVELWLYLMAYLLVLVVSAHDIVRMIRYKECNLALKQKLRREME